MVPVAMVGRARELAELIRAWSAVAGAQTGPRPRTAVVTGEAGGGKSMLVNAALAAFDPPPATVLSGRARMHTPAAYDWLGAVLAESPVPDELRAAVRTVRELVGAGPAVLVVEDLHALDPASLNLIGELAGTPNLPALLLVTSRPPDEAAAPHLTARTLAHLTGTPGAVRQHLRPLTPTEVTTLLDRAYRTAVPTEVATGVYDRSGGNPYWIMELIAAEPTVPAHNGLPDHVRRLVLGRLAGAGTDARRLAAVAAGLGERVDPHELAGIVGFDPGPALRELGALGVLTVDGDALHFRPPLVREALAAVPHVTASDAGLRAAHDHLAAGLPEAALRAVEVALPTAPDPVPLLRVATAAAGAAARDPEAAGYAARWLRLVPPNDLLDRAAAHRELATAQGRLGRHADCAAQLDAARRLLTEADPDAAHPEWARLLAAVAEAHLRADRPTDAARTAREALAAGADPATEGAATVTLAAALADLDEPEPGMALLRTARRAAAERRDLATLGRAVACLAGRYLRHLDEPAAWSAFDEAMATATRFGLEHETGPTIVAGVRLAIRVGDAARAAELVSARLPLEPDPGLRETLVATAGLLAADAGDLTRAAELADASGTGPVAAVLRVALGGPVAEVPAEFDRPDPRWLTEAARRALSSGVPVDEVRDVLAARLGGALDGPAPAFAQLRCALLAASGDDEPAVEAGRAGLPGTVAWLDADTHLTVGRCLVRLGRVDEARSHGAAAAALLARWPGRLHAAVAEFTASLEVATPLEFAAPVAELTAREVEVLSCLVAGMSNKQVARSLGISVRTVTVHVSNLLRKTRSSSRTEAALWAVRHRAGV